MNVTIDKDTRKRDGWVRGKVGNRLFQAKVFDEGSIYGINNGRISKLCLTVANAKKVRGDNLAFNYDRDESHNVDAEVQNEFNRLLKVLESLPKVFA